MKKLSVLLASLLLLFSANDASASGFLVKAGMNFPSLDLKNLKSFSMKSYTGWHAGVGYQTGSAAGFSFQPELNFVRNSANVEDGDVTTTVYTNMLQFAPNVQWGIDLLIFKPYLFVSPYAALNLGNNLKNPTQAAKDLVANAKKLDYGIGAGIGIDIWKFQVTGKYTWSFGNVLNWQEYYTQLKDIRLSNGAFVLSAAFVF